MRVIQRLKRGNVGQRAREETQVHLLKGQRLRIALTRMPAERRAAVIAQIPSGLAVALTGQHGQGVQIHAAQIEPRALARNVQRCARIAQHVAVAVAHKLDFFIIRFAWLADSGLTFQQHGFAIFLAGKQQQRVVAIGHYSRRAVLKLQIRQGRITVVALILPHGLEQHAAWQIPNVTRQRGGRRQGEKQDCAHDDGNHAPASHQNPPPLVEHLPGGNSGLIGLRRRHSAHSCLRPRQSTGQTSRGQPRPYQSPARRNW